MSAPTPFGTGPDGVATRLFTLTSDVLRVRVTDYGGRLVAIEAPDRDGARDHVVLGFEDVAGYMASGSFGALLGRSANRIAGARFTLDGQTHHLVANEGETMLHGGKVGFNKRMWTVESATSAQLALTLESADGDQGFPGAVSARATYALDGAALTLTLEAVTTKPTPVNLSAHPYFNLAGAAALDVHDHEMTVQADQFLPTDAKQVPTGEIRAVAGTPFDLRAPTRIGPRLRATDPQLLLAHGFDHHYVLTGRAGTLHEAVRLTHAPSGRTLRIETTQPGVQVYTGNNLNGAVVGRGGTYRQGAGVAFEPQGFPDAPNQPVFPSTILRPGEHYRQTIRYVFEVDEAPL